MKRMISLAAALFLAAPAAYSATVEVLGTAAVYGEGLTGGSTAPVSISLGGGSGQTVTFSSVTGLVDCCSGTPNVGPDGGGGSTGVTGLNGLSGIQIPRRLFLAGVFISTVTAPTSPASLSYTLADLSSLSFAPLLDQVFFIGDGLTGTGTGAIQEFIAPTGADALVLGFVDGFGFNGVPSYYGDNTGSMSATYDINAAAAVPLPASGLLLLLGVGGIATLRRKRETATAATA